MLPEQLLEQIKEIAEAYADGHTCRALADLADNEAERAHLTARFDYWNSEVSAQWSRLTVAVNSALPPTLYAAPDPTAPVSTPNNRDVEVRGSLGQRAVAIRFTCAQAVAVGTAMIVCAAGTTERGGGRLSEILPPIPTSPPGPPVRPT